MNKTGFFGSLFGLLGALISTVPPIIAVLLYFPLWRSEGIYTAISGISLLLLMICALPIFNLLKRILKSPSVPTVWLIIFLFFLFISRVADEITVISFVGFISNIIGSLFFRLSKKGKVSTDEIKT